METILRSAVKAVMWQAIGFASMSVVGRAASGSWALGGAIAGANCVVGLALYLLYERLWTRIRWGRRQN